MESKSITGLTTYKERLEKELGLESCKHAYLGKFIESSEFDKVSEAEKTLLLKQQGIMLQYIQVLSKRVNIAEGGGVNDEK